MQDVSQKQAAMPARVCLLTETYFPVVGGGETQARLLMEGLRSRGFDAMVITRRSDASFARVENVGGVEVYRLSPSGMSHLNKWGLLFSTSLVLIRLRRRYDLVLVSGFRVLGISAALAKRLLGKPCVLKADSIGEMSGEFFHGGLKRLGLKPTSWMFKTCLSGRNRLLRSADRFVAISSTIEREFQDYGIEPLAITRIPNAVDLKTFQPATSKEKRELRSGLGLPVAAQIVVYTGRFVAYKGLPLLLQVWRDLLSALDSRLLLLLVGSGGLDIQNCEEELRSYTSNHGLDGWVRFAGPSYAVEEYLRASDIFAFPTEQEAFGISLIEAMACGLAAVSTDVGGLKDIVRDRENSIVVPPGDFNCLRDALLLLLRNRSLADCLGRRAHLEVSERYSSETVVDRYVEVVESLFAC